MALAFAAVNIQPESAVPAHGAAAVESVEAQETRVSKAYEKSLQLIHSGAAAAAQVGAIAAGTQGNGWRLKLEASQTCMQLHGCLLTSWSC